MPFDFEHKAQAQLTKAKQLTIGLVGFGTFGQFLARRLVQAGHKVRRPPLSAFPGHRTKDKKRVSTYHPECVLSRMLQLIDFAGRSAC